MADDPKRKKKPWKAPKLRRIKLTDAQMPGTGPAIEGVNPAS